MRARRSKLARIEMLRPEPVWKTLLPRETHRPQCFVVALSFGGRRSVASIPRPASRTALFWSHIMGPADGARKRGCVPGNAASLSVAGALARAWKARSAQASDLVNPASRRLYCCPFKTHSPRDGSGYQRVPTLAARAARVEARSHSLTLDIRNLDKLRDPGQCRAIPDLPLWSQFDALLQGSDTDAVGSRFLRSG